MDQGQNQWRIELYHGFNKGRREMNKYFLGVLTYQYCPGYVHQETKHFLIIVIWKYKEITDLIQQ